MPACRLFILLGLLAAALAGCRRAAEAPAARPAEVRHPLTGVILKVEAEQGVLIVQHEEIKGYMPAMTMELAVGPEELAVARAGRRIRADLVEGADGVYRLERIWPDDASTEAKAVAAAALQLRQDTHTRGRHPYREVGEVTPDFALLDQDGRVVQMARFRGKQVLLNFIFTRCPVATMCPAATAKMITVQRLAREAGVGNLELISITLDPAHDTPGVLHAYAAIRGIDTGNFSFLTGPTQAIRDLLAQFGISTQFQGDILQHTLATVLIAPDGRIAHRTDGSQWDPEEFVRRLSR
jgi:protein SCO1/2